MIDPRLASAVAAGKAVTTLTRGLRVGGGTTLPGLIATRVDPKALDKLSRRLAGGAVVVTGTNGKTTTCRLIASCLESSGSRLVHNRAGANLVSGVASALIDNCDWLARPTADVGLFEVDEATLPRVFDAIDPDVVVIVNLFRDQLDRYGEIDHVAGLWRATLEKLSETSTLVLNADDPTVAYLGHGRRGGVLYFGIDDPSVGQDRLDHASDSTVCPVCGAALTYLQVFFSHLGDYHCLRCDWARPARDVSAARVISRGIKGSTLAIRAAGTDLSVTLPLPGNYNVYNALAALSASKAMGIEVERARVAIETTSAAFGRVERVSLGDQELFLALIKNPVGCNQVLRMILSEPGEHDFVILINDELADGTDISWLWDADFELLVGRCRSVVVGGTRGADMLVRLKYAGVDRSRFELATSIPEAIESSARRDRSAGVRFVLPTYTAMIELHNFLSRHRYARAFWKN